jgi:RNA polymerase sigma-70 factor, ECF subfamily
MPDQASNVGPEDTSAPAAAYLARAGGEGNSGVVTPMDAMHGQAVAPVERAPRDAWLDQLYQGDRKVLEEIYQQQFDRIDAAVGTVLNGADRETVVHEVFLRLLRDEPFRRLFRGGDVGAWLAVVARNMAIDYSRRRNRESPSGIDLGSTLSTGDEVARSAEARLLIERFLRDVLPPAWLAVFQARFIAHLSQAEAAARLGKRRTTLAYQELRIRRLLRKFLLEEA